jgi:hypothetical protein
MQQLYESEINAGLESDWDSGFRVWVAGGHERLSERTFLRQEFDEIADWLDQEAQRLFPDSLYGCNCARWHVAADRTHSSDGHASYGPTDQTGARALRRGRATDSTAHFART